MNPLLTLLPHPAVLIFALLVTTAGSAMAGHPPDNRAEVVYRQRLEQGVEAFYQADWDQADSVFNSLQKQAPERPEAYFFESMMPFWAYFFGGKSQQEAQKFLVTSERVLEKCRKRLEEQPRDTTMILMLSGVHGYRSLVAADQKSYQTAIQSGLTGYRYSKQLLRLNSDDPGAWVGKGMINYMLGSVPSGLQWAVDLAGLSGDREEGFEMLRRAANSNSHVSAEAKMLLTYLYHREERYDDAVESITALVKQYPSNPIFQYYYGSTMEQLNHPGRAREAYQKVVSINMDRFQHLAESAGDKLEKL